MTSRSQIAMSAINKKNKSVSSSLQTQQDKTSMLDVSHTNSHQLGGYVKVHQPVEQPKKMGSNLVHRQAVIANIGQALGNSHLQGVITQPTSKPTAISSRVQHTNVIARQGDHAKPSNAHPTLSTPSKQDTGFGEALQKIIAQEGGITVAIYVSKKSGFTDQSTFQTQASSFAKDHQAVGVIGNQLVIGSAMPATTAADVVRGIQNSLSLVREITGQKAVRISTFAIFTHGLNDYLNLGKGNRISSRELDAQAKDESEEIKNFVAAVDSALSDTARVVMYSCLTASTYVPIPKKENQGKKNVSPQTIAQDIRTGGEGSFADKLRDALTANGQKREVWGHRTRGHTTRNPNWRLFAGAQSGEAASMPLFGEETDVSLEGVKDPHKKRSYLEQQKLSKTGVAAAANAVSKLANAVQSRLDQVDSEPSLKKHNEVKASKGLRIWVGREIPFVPPNLRPCFDDQTFSDELVQWFVKRYYLHHSESKPLAHTFEQEALHEGTQTTKPAQQGTVGNSNNQSPAESKADTSTASNAKSPIPPTAITNVHQNAPVTKVKGDVKQRGLNHIIERNSEFASFLGWYSQSDKIVAYFQKLDLLPQHQPPTPENFARAIRDYQRHHPELAQDGILGPATWSLLRVELAFGAEYDQTQQAQAPVNFRGGLSNGTELIGETNKLTTPVIPNSNKVSSGNTNGFELAAEIVGKSEGSYDSINTWDRGKVSYGRYQFALITSHLFKVLNRWINNPDSTKQAPEAHVIIKDRLERVRKHDGSLARDKEFLAALRQAGSVVSMQKTQDEYWQESFFTPAAKKAEKQGVNSAIGKAIFTDTNTQGGLKSVIERTAHSLEQRTDFNAITDSYERERFYLHEFLTQRSNYLLHLAEKNQQKSQECLKEALQLRSQGKESEAKGLEGKAKSLEKTSKAFIGAATSPRGRIARLRNRLAQELPKQNANK